MNQKELFTLLDVTSEEELLRHFPSRYEDLTLTGVPSEPKEGNRVVLKGVPFSLRQTSARNFSIIRFKIVAYRSNIIDCIVFNQPFYIQKLSAKKEFLFVLYYSESRRAYIVSSIHDTDSYAAMTGIKPVYSLPKGVSNSYFSNIVKNILSTPLKADGMRSHLPSRLIEKYRLLDEFSSFRCVHLPRNKKDLYEGLRVFKYEEALSYCVKALSLRREMDERKKETVLPIPHKEVNLFVKKLSYKLTQDQLLAIREIVLDMEKEKIMYRLLQGDVGTGKTIVSFIALYANFLRGNQGVLMAPTFELAMQHYENVKKVFKDYPIQIGFLAGSSLSAKEKRDTLRDLSTGQIQILIATHSAISQSVVFQSLGLAIIDEQQLFGVKQRQELLNKGKSCDVLMMSATPIPRTLSQIINADLDVSTLTMFPHGIRNVKTVVTRSADDMIYKGIDKALEVHRQVFIVAPKISEGNGKASSAESVFEEINKRYPGKASLLHGKIKKEMQDEIIKNFISQEKPILVSTTVIQVGIDVSSACLLIVYDANYFGLSTLHQLRGRIGRSGDFALAILVYDGNDIEAKEKLDFLANSNDGLAISQFDLKQRGGGSYSGTDQSGDSELQVCNFVDDLKMFECAKEDAKEILSNPLKEDNAAYLKSLDPEKNPVLG